LENAIPGKAGPESACEEQGPSQHRTRDRRQPGNRDGEDQLEVSRAPGAIRAEIEALKHDHKYDRSRQCTNATDQSSRQLCARIRKAEARLKDAEKAEKPRAQLRSLEASLAGLNLQKVLSRADPAAEAVARVVGQDPGTVRHVLALMIAILIEAGSAFGFGIVALLGQPRGRGRNRASGVEVRRPPRRDRLTAPQMPLQQWGDRYIERDAASVVTAAALKAHHEAWASSRGVSPANPTKIGRPMTGLGFKREKVKGRNRYAGARLIELESGLRLAVDNAGRP
jgi:hypothetical protein